MSPDLQTDVSNMVEEVDAERREMLAAHAQEYTDEMLVRKWAGYRRLNYPDQGQIPNHLTIASGRLELLRPLTYLNIESLRDYGF